MTMGIKGFYGENFVDETAVASSVAATRAVYVGGTQGAVRAQLIAGAGGCTIASGKKFTLTSTECNASDGSFASTGVTVVKTHTAATTYAPGDVIAEIAFASDGKKYGKVAVACDDTTATGKIKVVADIAG